MTKIIENSLAMTSGGRDITPLQNTTMLTKII